MIFWDKIYWRCCVHAHDLCKHVTDHLCPALPSKKLLYTTISCLQTTFEESTSVAFSLCSISTFECYKRPVINHVQYHDWFQVLSILIDLAIHSWVVYLSAIWAGCVSFRKHSLLFVNTILCTSWSHQQAQKHVPILRPSYVICVPLLPSNVISLKSFFCFF